ncbi:general odorant-binding protein 56a-like [Haematobia irritans]|uniref:general odorant-binding protein 56a-like n=1 Tax=Haematobia irritans TaxID=7368 RepID=UPI003F50C892
MKSIAVQLSLGLLVLFGCLELPQVLGNSLTPEALQKLAETCMKESDIKPEESKMILADQLEKLNEKDFTSNMKCFLHCFYKKLGVTDDNGDPIDAPFLAFMEARFGDKKDKVKPAIAKCSLITDANPCEHVFKIEFCMAHEIEGVN